MITNNGPLAHDAVTHLAFRTKTSEGHYLEIGSFNGLLVASLAHKGPPSKLFYCIDPFIDDGNTTHLTKVPDGGAIPQVEAHFYTNTAGLPIILFKQSSKEFYVRNYGNLSRFGVDTVFIDGNHRFDHVINDLYLAADLLAWTPDGYIYLDDYNVEDVRQGVSVFLHKFNMSIAGSDLIRDIAVILHLNQKRP